MDIDKLIEHDNRLQKYDTTPQYKAMGYACIKQACIEYRTSTNYATVLKCINFFYSGTYKLMCALDPEVLMNYLDNPPGMTGEWDFVRRPKAVSRQQPKWMNAGCAQRIWNYKERAKNARKEKKEKENELLRKLAVD